MLPSQSSSAAKEQDTHQHALALGLLEDAETDGFAPHRLVSCVYH